MGTERGQPTEESKKTSTQNTYVNLVSVSCLVLQLLPVTAAVCSKKRTAPHDTAPQKTKGKARNRTALRCRAIFSRAELTWGALFVIK